MDDELDTLGWVETRSGQFKMECQVWLRANPPAMARLQSGPFEQHMIIQGVEHTIRNSHGTHVMVREGSTPFAVGSLWRRLYIPDLASVSAMDSETEATLPDTAAWSRVDETIDGQSVIVYARRTLLRNFEVEERITVDAHTSRMISKTSREFDLESHNMVSEVICDRYSEGPPPDGMFEIISTGPVTRTDMNAYQAEHNPRIKDESALASIKAVVEACDSSWLIGNWSEFARCWDFSVYNYLPDEAAWRQIFDKYAGKWTEWASTASNITKTERIVFPSTTSSFRLMPTQGNVVEVRAELHCARSADRSFDGHIEYFLQESPIGYHIAYARIPFEEIAIKTAPKP